jgi:hypothetical protein
MSEPCRLADHYSNASTTIAASRKFLYSPIIERDSRRSAVLDKDLGKLTASTQGSI